MIKEQRTVIKEQSEDTPTEIACLTLFSVHFSLFFCIVLCSLFIVFACDDSPDGPTTQTVATPTANPNGGTHTDSVTVALSCATGGAGIYYTLNGNTPSASSSLYTVPITINTTTTLKAIAVKDGMNNSGVLTVTYIISNPQLQTVATPTASLAGGEYATAQTVVLSCATDGADIYYTADGSTPGASSTPYTVPISISTTTTLKAIAIKSGMNNSGLLSVTYTIGNPQLQTVETPTANLETGTYTARYVILSCATDGADIYYTLDGSDPKENGQLYGSIYSIYLNTNTTLRAIAKKNGMNDSGEFTATYTIVLYINPAYTYAGLTASVIVPAVGTVTIDINGYDFANSPYIGYNSYFFSSAFYQYLGGRDVVVTINGAPGTEFVSLTDIHYLYWGIYRMSNPDIVEPPNPQPIRTELVPSYSGGEWVGWLFHSYTRYDDEKKYYDSETEIMTGMTVKFHTFGDDTQYYIEYNRPLNIEDLVYDDPYYDYDLRGHYRFGIIPAPGLPIIEHRDWNGVIDGDTYDYGEFFKHLQEIGLMGLSYGGLDSSVRIIDWAAPAQYNMFFSFPYMSTNRSNIVSDGLLNFIRYFYDDAEKKSCLDGMYYSGGLYGFDGLPAITAENPRIDADGKHNPAFTANITTEFAKWIMDKLGINTFANTNIIGDGKYLLPATATDAIVPISLRNVNLVGDHNANNLKSYGLMYEGNFSGVIFAEGISPRIIKNTSRGGYLIINDVKSTEPINFNMGFNRFKVVDIRVDASKAQYVGKISTILDDPGADAIIYNQKYATTCEGTDVPYYRAVRNSSGTPLLTGTTAQGFAAKYASQGTAQNVPPLDPTAWINAANQATPADPAYRTWANVPTAEKWTAADFGALPEVP